MQTIANVTHSPAIELQTSINKKGVESLKSYSKAYIEFLASGKGRSKEVGELPKLLFELEEKVASRSSSSFYEKDKPCAWGPLCVLLLLLLVLVVVCSCSCSR